MIRILFIAALYSFGLSGICQNPDSILLANSESWKVQQHKGLFGLAKPEFGPYITVSVSRFDSAFSKKKTKGDGSIEISSEETGAGIDFDHSKSLKVEKTKAYRLSLASNEDTIRSVFLISSISNERKQTFLGKLLSKNDEGKHVVLSYNRDVLGMISLGQNVSQWKFFLDNFTSGGRATEESNFPLASISGGWLNNGTDSLFLQVSSSFSADLIIANQQGMHLAALSFKQKPFTVWIRNDLETSMKNAIAALIAVIFSIKDI